MTPYTQSIYHDASKLYDALNLLESSYHESEINRRIQNISQSILKYKNISISAEEWEPLNKILKNLSDKFTFLIQNGAFSIGWGRKVKEFFGLKSQTKHSIYLAINNIYEELSLNLNSYCLGKNYQLLFDYGFNESHIHQCVQFIKTHAIEAKGLKIYKKNQMIPFTIIVTPNHNRYLLFTRKTNQIFGSGTYKTAKLCIDLNIFQQKIVTITKYSRLKKTLDLSTEEWKNVVTFTRIENTVNKHLNKCINLATTEDFFEELDSQNNVIRIYSFMKKYSHGNLRDALQYHSSILRKKYTIIEDIINGLKYLHNKNLIHRDIKPENILISSYENNLKNYQLETKPHQNSRSREFIAAISDFGSILSIANENASLDEENLAEDCTTDKYKSPELCQSKIFYPYSKQSDIWALGCTIFEILLPTHQFIALNLLDSENLDVCLKLASSHHPIIYNFLQGMLKTNPIQRWDIDQIYTYYKHNININ